jgi:type IV secretory pathway VirB4 component
VNPIFSVKGHELTSLKGTVSSFYEIKAPDLDGFDRDSKERIFLDLESDLIKTSHSFKLYWLKRELYLNAFGVFDLSHGQVLPKNDPLKAFSSMDKTKIEFYENYLTQGNEYIRIISVTDFPQSFKMLSTYNWPDFVLNFQKIPKIEAKSRINMKRKLHFSAIFKTLRNVESENAFQQAETLLEDVTMDQKALFRAEMFLILRAETKNDLDIETDRILYDFKGMGAILFVEERGLSFFYQCLVPGLPASFKRAIDVPSDCLSYMIPFHRDFVMDKGLKLHSRKGNEVYFDLFSPEALNYNVLITGSSGQGKSMMANKLLWEELASHRKAMVLDLGNSFAKNAKFHGGVILSERFNPYQFKNPRYLKEFILAVMDERISKREEGRLYETIVEIVQNPDIKSFNDLLIELEKTFEGIGFYFNEIAEYFTDEIYELNDFTYCDFSLYPDAMKAPLIIYLIEYFKHLEGEKIFIFDECWHLLLKNADYIAECFRTFRKHKASAVAISQNMDDFSSTQLGRVIIQNTYYKFLFRQSLNNSEFIDSHAKEILDSVQSIKGEYSEFLLLTDLIRKPLRFYPTPLEYQVMTSAREDNEQFESYLELGGRVLPFIDAIKNFTEIKNPYWSER